MIRFRDIAQRVYPYSTFRIQSNLSAEGGLSAKRSVLCQQAKPAVYLTFDDGPIPEVTPKVLAILERYGVKATFFMVGENIDKHPEVLEQVVRAGHSIGNHTYNHLKGWKTDYQTYMSNVHKWEETVKNHHSPLTINHSPLFRPPYGKATLRQRIALHRQGYRLIYWDILTRDYESTRTPEAMLAQIKRKVRPGSIINFHDSLKSNERMLAVLPQAIEWLQKQGYELKAL